MRANSAVSGSGAVEPPALLRPPTRTERSVISILVLFLLFFPKGGIKLGGIPLTWGYVALGAVALCLPLALVQGKSWQIRREWLILALALVPFQLITWLSFVIHGVIGIGFTVSLVVSFFFIPYVFLFILGPALDRMDLSYLFRWIRAGVFFVAVYGIFLFFYRFLAGEFLEIPFLTVNAGDLGELDGKYIDRGGIFKLISTYNNGNIYGICILMLLPLYTWLEDRSGRRLAVKLSLLLTLSRTVWVGLLFFEVIQRAYVRRISLRAIGLLAGSLVFVGAGIFGALQFMGVDPGAFLLDRNLGGRIEQLNVLSDAPILPRGSFEHILEMVYFSILENFGLLGLVSYLFGMTLPLWFQLFGVAPNASSEYKRSVMAGMAVYLVVSLSDGALLFIPVVAFYWFLATLVTSQGRAMAPEFQRDPTRQDRPSFRRRSRARPPWLDHTGPDVLEPVS